MRDVPKFVLAAVLEDEAGAGHEVLMVLVARTCQGSAIAASLAPTCTVMARTASPSSLLNRAHMGVRVGLSGHLMDLTELDPSAANLDIATIDREWEPIRRVVGAEGGGVFKRSHTEERRNVGRRPGALAVVSHVPPTTEADERRLVGLADRSADPGIVADHREEGDLALGCERDPVFDVTVVEPTVGAPVAPEPGGESELLEHERI